ncbi:hypothetical protein Godav_015692 [Gossypium davidsonii]|nr:hypothetical protein [Gossypium davidsonii]
MGQTILALWRPIQGINIEPGENLEEIKFLYADFWVQVHDLPSCFVSETLAKSIGNLMDQFLKYDVSSQRNFLNNFMRTRVRLDICVPHMRKKNIRALGGKSGPKKFGLRRVSYPDPHTCSSDVKEVPMNFEILMLFLRRNIQFQNWQEWI